VKLPATTVANADRVKGICYTQTGDHCQSTQAVFSSPRDIVLDAKGNIYITDISAGKIRRIDVKTGIVTTFAGGAGGGWEDGQLHAPSGLAIGPNGILYVADKVNNVVRQVIPPTKDAKKASLVTIAGLGPNSPGCAQEGVVAATAPLTRPQDVAVDAAGNIYIADTGCRKIRVISKAGTISTLVGTGADHVGVPLEVPFTGSKGIGTAVNLAYPVGIAVDGVGNLVISDPGFDVLWLYRAKSQTVKVLAGLIPGQNTLAVCASARNVQGDGCVGTAAFLNIPGKPALDSSGNIYIPEQGGTKTPTHPFDVRILRPAAK
jgi:streptogramin lyase